MEHIGLNKKLLDRRKQLDYSTREASIRLDIYRWHLYLIEHGYVKVKNKKLQNRFIKKYNLEEDFFTKDELLYPTPIEEIESDEVKKPSKIGKILVSWPFRIVDIILTIGFFAMAISGLSMYPKLTKETSSFYSEKFNNVKEVTRSDKGIKHAYIDSHTSYILATDYHSFEKNEESNIKTPGFEGFYYSSINFIDNDEYLNYTNAKCRLLIRNPLQLDLGTFPMEYESRVVNGLTRVQFNIYYFDEKTSTVDYNYSLLHISADIHGDNSKIDYNIIEAIDPFSILKSYVPVEKDSFQFYFYSYLFEKHLPSCSLEMEDFFKENENILKIGFKEFLTEFNNGLVFFNNYQNLTNNLTIWGLVLGILFLAICVFKWIKTLIQKVNQKVFKNEVVSPERFFEQTETNNKKKRLPKNRWPLPFVPEFVIRIGVLLILLFSSLGLFFLYENLMRGDILATLNNISFGSQTSAITTISIMLIFFIKLDIEQSKKSTFFANYFLFFIGLIFYCVLIIVNLNLSYSSGNLTKFYQSALSILPGNFIWGVLAFNCMSSILFSTPKFKTHSKIKMCLYRSLIILPLGYLVISSLYQIGKNAWGWNLPFEISSLLFSKAIILTIFSILYCFTIYFYKLIIRKKYKEDALIYQHGNRYIYIKNILVCVIVALLGIFDIEMGKHLDIGNPYGLGSSSVILFSIPFILFYHPHFGKRNIKWDLLFSVLYPVCLLMGVLLVGLKLSSYLAFL